jgi:hypothetical protein
MFLIGDGEAAISFAFSPDSSFLIVGTLSGRLFSYIITNNVIDPTPGEVIQNANEKAVYSISVSSNLQIAAGGGN